MSLYDVFGRNGIQWGDVIFNEAIYLILISNFIYTSFLLRLLFYAITGIDAIKSPRIGGTSKIVLEIFIPLFSGDKCISLYSFNYANNEVYQ